MMMCNLFYIPVKLISRQDHPWSFIPTYFGARYTRSMVLLVTNVAHRPYYVFIFDLTTHFIKGCRTIINSSVVILFLIRKVITGFFLKLQPRVTRSFQTTTSDTLDLSQIYRYITVYTDSILILIYSITK